MRQPIKVPADRYDELLSAEREYHIYMRATEHVRRYQLLYISPLGTESPVAYGWYACIRAWRDGIEAATEEVDDKTRPSHVLDRALSTL